MGIKSTHYLTRDTALQVLTALLYKADDEALADMLESKFRTYKIVSKEDFEHLRFDDITRPDLLIRNIDEFNGN